MPYRPCLLTAVSCRI